jgi:hypothetical protein
MPGYSSLHLVGAWRPRIPATYPGFASFQNLTWPRRSISLHTVGPEGPTDYVIVGYGDYIELPLQMVREATLYATDDPEAGEYVVGFLFTSQRVRYSLTKAGWTGALLGFGGTPGGGTPVLIDSFDRPDGAGLGVADSGQDWAGSPPMPWATAAGGRIDSHHAWFAGGDSGNPLSATALGLLPFPLVASLDFVEISSNYGGAGFLVRLSDGWVCELTVSPVWNGVNYDGAFSLYFYPSASGRSGANVYQVGGPCDLPPVTATLTIGPNGAEAFGHILAAPPGVVFAGAADFTLLSDPSGIDPVILDNLSVIGG